MRYLCYVYLFCVIDRGKNGLLDLRDGAAMIFCIACKKFLHLLLLSSLLAFLDALQTSFRTSSNEAMATFLMLISKVVMGQSVSV
jgi:hypothetical protein